MYTRLVDPDGLGLTDEQRRSVWQRDESGRVFPTAAIYASWYTEPASRDCLPLALSDNLWWPAPDELFESDIPPVANAWLAKCWPSAAANFSELAELCWLRRSRTRLIADALTVFWSEHLVEARALFVARYLPQAFEAWLAGLLSIDSYDVVDDNDAWCEHVDWFLARGIRAHAPSRRRGPGQDGGSDEPGPDVKRPAPNGSGGNETTADLTGDPEGRSP